MQSLGVTGKIYGLKSKGTAEKPRVTFRLSVRKRFVSDQDKKDGKTQTFMPCIAYGSTAEFINQYFNDQDVISVGDMEYQTYSSQNNTTEYDDAHIFKVEKVGFVPGANNGDSSGDSASQGSGRRSQRSAPPATESRRPRRETVPAQETPIDISDDDLPF